MTIVQSVNMIAISGPGERKGSYTGLRNDDSLQLPSFETRALDIIIPCLGDRTALNDPEDGQYNVG